MNRAKLERLRAQFLRVCGAATNDDLSAVLADDEPDPAKAAPVGEWFAQLTKAGPSTFYLLVRGVEVVGQLTQDSDVKTICSALNASQPAKPETGRVVYVILDRDDKVIGACELTDKILLPPTCRKVPAVLDDSEAGT